MSIILVHFSFEREGFSVPQWCVDSSYVSVFDWARFADRYRSRRCRRFYPSAEEQLQYQYDV